ncbi:SRR1-like protein [Teleopsis dalmanni]|uniref:SRR1-like protein n=1 Tax=Teleopsis dalmanni TaxID=139649 RepID=UPI0018CCCB5B|nr:SRR1-like protein [Teleopsis dalmanni]
MRTGTRISKQKQLFLKLIPMTESVNKHEEFLPVTRKKWICKKKIAKTHKHILDNKCLAEDFQSFKNKFIVKLNKQCNDMSTCDYFAQAIKVLEQSLREINTEAQNIEKVICFGLGPFTRHVQALHQLVFVICVQRLYKVKECLYFDPIFNETERKILHELNCFVMSENCEAKYEVEQPTLFYMPHCPGPLTNNLLWCNWEPKKLQNVILINNSFESITSNQPERILRTDLSYILDIQPYVKEFIIEDDYELQSIFNDLSVHAFPRFNLPPPDSDFWQKKDAPVYTDDSILTLNFATLKL